MARLARNSGLVLIALSWAALLAILGSAEILLFTVPVFMLAAPLALGRYVGEELIERIARMVGPARRAASPDRRRLPAGHTVRAGLALSARLSGRAPPLPV